MSRMSKSGKGKNATIAMKAKEPSAIESEIHPLHKPIGL